jgi:DNA-binding beta-propeller fold protein YncE
MNVMGHRSWAENVINVPPINYLYCGSPRVRSGAWRPNEPRIDPFCDCEANFRNGNWNYAIADVVGRRLYVARDYGVMTIDLDSGVVTPRLVSGRDVHGIAEVGNTGVFVSANGDADTATIFQGKTGKVLGTVNTGKDPDFVVFEPKSHLIVVLNQKSGNATLLDPNSRKVVGTISIGGTPEAAAVDERGHVYVNVTNKNQIAAIDVSVREVTDAIPLKGCDEPTGLTYDAADQLLISVCFNGVAEFVDPKTHRQLAQVITGKIPDAVIWDVNRRLAFVPSFADGNLTVIAVGNTNDIKVIQTLPTRMGTRTGALDAKAGAIYLPTSKLNPPAKEGAYPTPVPGTFEVLVVASEQGASH